MPRPDDHCGRCGHRFREHQRYLRCPVGNTVFIRRVELAARSRWKLSRERYAGSGPVTRLFMFEEALRRLARIKQHLEDTGVCRGCSQAVCDDCTGIDRGGDC